MFISFHIKLIKKSYEFLNHSVALLEENANSYEISWNLKFLRHSRLIINALSIKARCAIGCQWRVAGEAGTALRQTRMVEPSRGKLPQAGAALSGHFCNGCIATAEHSAMLIP